MHIGDGRGEECHHKSHQDLDEGQRHTGDYLANDG